jgi:hypothetical protein
MLHVPPLGNVPAADWPVVYVLIDVQRGAIGILTALERIRHLINASQRSAADEPVPE